jgi:cation diffusion facilitator CzcD-associated flavoprotein CzcO
VSRDDFLAYLDEYARRFGIEPEFGVDVARLDRVGSLWRLDTSAGARQASAVVMATGYSRIPFVPDWPGRGSFTGAMIHSADYRSPTWYSGQQVLVVGAGNSASEIAVELAKAGAKVDLSVRTVPNIVRRDTFGIPSQLLGIALKNTPELLMNPLSTALRRLTVPSLDRYGLPAPRSGAFTQFLRTCTVPILDHGFVQQVRHRRITVVSAVAEVAGNTIRLVDGTALRPDAVICATGYRPGLSSIVGHLNVLNADGVPIVHGPQSYRAAPNLYFVGITVELAGLLREIGLEALAVGRVLANRHGALSV